MKTLISNLKLSGIAAALPKQTTNLLSLAEKFGVREVGRIIQGTGIKSIHTAPDYMKASDLCGASAEVLLKHLQIDPNTIDGIVYITQMPDRVAPPTSVMLQHKLGLTKQAVAFDINYGCSGYMCGLYQAALLISSNSCNRVLVCAGDVITKLVHEDDIGLRMLLGDAGTATIVEKGTDEWEIAIYTDGSGADHLTAGALLPTQIAQKSERHNYYYMDGKAVMNFALGPVVHDVVQEVCAAKNWPKHDITLFMHQANAFMVNLLRLKIGLKEDRVPIAVETTGNTGAASIPLMLSMTGDYFKEAGKLTKSILCGFGVGLSWGAIGLDLSQTQIIKPIEIE